MKRIVFYILFSIFCLSAYCQYPIQQNLGNGSTLVSVPANGALRAGLINRVYGDTTAANLTPIKNYPSAQIFTLNDSALWFRNKPATAWILLGSAAGGANGVFWKINGNVFPVIPSNFGFGTRDATAIPFMTDGVTRFTLPATGLSYSNVSTDSLLARDVSGNLVLVPKTAVGSFYNSNVGSAYRLAIPNTNNIKTLGDNYGIILDSATSNQIGVKADSATLAAYFLRRKDSATGTNLNGYLTRSSLPTYYPGIDDVLAVGQALTSNRAINMNGNRLTFTGNFTSGMELNFLQYYTMYVDDNAMPQLKFTNEPDFSGGSYAEWSTTGNSREAGFYMQQPSLADTTPVVRMFSGGTNGNHDVETSIQVRPNNVLFYLNGARAKNFTMYNPLRTSDTSWKALAWNPSDSTIKVMNSWPTGSGGSTRFGVSGEDATAAQNRLFTLSGFTFGISGLPSGAGTKALRVDGSGNFTLADTTSYMDVVASYDAIGLSSTTTNAINYTTPNIGNATVYDIGCKVTVTAIAGGGVLTTTVTYTDETNTSRTITFYSMGTTSAGLTATGVSNFPTMGEITAYPNTAITLSTTLTIGTATFSLSADLRYVRKGYAF